MIELARLICGLCGGAPACSAATMFVAASAGMCAWWWAANQPGYVAVDPYGGPMGGPMMGGPEVVVVREPGMMGGPMMGGPMMGGGGMIMCPTCANFVPRMMRCTACGYPMW